MPAMSIGVISDSFRLAPRDGIAKAAALGADGVQMYAVSGELAPEALDGAARRDLKAFIAAEGLVISALCGDLGGHGFHDAAENATKVPRSKQIVDLAVDLGTRVVTTHIGVVPEDRACQSYKTMLKACQELGAYAAERGVTFAIETGPEPADRLATFLQDTGTEGIGVNLDPANLVMVLNADPVEAVHTLAPWIVHTHAKDGVHLQDCDAQQVYGAFAEGGFSELVAQTGELFREVPLGAGGVDWDAYLKALAAIGFTGFLTIEREVGDDPAADIAKAIDFLRGKLG